jgi:hypothetical protein
MEGLVTAFAELLSRFTVIFYISPAACARLPPILASYFVDTVSARIVSFERVKKDLTEPIKSHFMLHPFPRISTSFVDLDHVWLSLEGSSIEK